VKVWGSIADPSWLTWKNVASTSRRQSVLKTNPATSTKRSGASCFAVRISIWGSWTLSVNLLVKVRSPTVDKHWSSMKMSGRSGASLRTILFLR
jgi:hypothetical protein